MQVWRTSDGRSWNQEHPYWSNANTEALCAFPFGAHLYVGTGNMSGGEIWRTDGRSWWQVASGGLGDVNNYGFGAFAV